MTVHVPILVGPIVDALVEPLLALPDSAPAQWIVDCTLGGGGHTGAILERLASDSKLRRHKVLSVDQDADAVERARQRFAAELSQGHLELFHSRFSEIEEALTGRPVLGLMADLGFSSDQIEDPARGLSFQHEGPLDMRLDPTRGISAFDFLSRVNEQELERVLSEYGEERFSRRIAGAIVRSRREGRLPRTSRALADLIVDSVPPPARHGRIHAATRTFQALRIVINDELDELESLLGRVILSVKAGGRVAILSFHSLEDRRVKHAFKGGEFEPLTKKPIEAGEEEVRANPRARSAKLRIAERIGR